MKFLQNNYELLTSDTIWTVFINRPVYKQITAYDTYYIRNTKTGANCGQYLELHVQLVDVDGNELVDPIFEEDCYEIVNGGSDNND